LIGLGLFGHLRKACDFLVGSSILCCAGQVGGGC
jgi:hypothetical protein